MREDYSPHGTAWEYFPHDHARSRAYRWGEDGIAGVSDNHQRLCLSLALWNGCDPILKERLFGLTGNEGNHGEDVKECYYYLDSTPTHSWMRMLYKYPQRPFPYEDLVRTNRERGREQDEYELTHTGVFDESRYFDVFVDYGKGDVDDLCMRVTAHNRGPEAAPLHLLPTLCFRNTWSFLEGGRTEEGLRPRLEETSPRRGWTAIEAQHPTLGSRWLVVDTPASVAGVRPVLLFTENETNRQRLYGEANPTPYVKDGIGRRVLEGTAEGTVNGGQVGTRAAAWFRFDAIPAGGSVEVRVRLCEDLPDDDALGQGFADTMGRRQAEADAFYAGVQGRSAGHEDACRVQRQALAGLLWSKQFYHYDVSRWQREDASGKPLTRASTRNLGWSHLYNEDVISMPDKWEYPWYASWDLAFHCIPLALVDPEFAKAQLVLFLREWYQHPNGQIPAYEWAFDDVNPPVHAWAVWRVYKIEQRLRDGEGDREFLERAFHKLLLNFTWWVNRKDAAGNNIFEGGFLGLDNIGVFDRSAPLPTGGTIEQSDGTSWMGMFCLNMLAIALELARYNPAYSDIASKFFEHFTYIAHAINHLGDENLQLWDEEDGFFYDALCLPDGSARLLNVRSMVGLITLFAVETLEPDVVEALPEFRRRMLWFIENRPHLRDHIAYRSRPRDQAADQAPRRLLAIVGRDRLRRVLKPMLDESEFLSPYGIRALSRRHLDAPFVLAVNGQEYRVGYEPAESRSGMFGGNSNWRGPVWFPVNFLIIESLQKFHYYYGDEYRVECPTGSGRMLHLGEVAEELSRRLCRLFLRDASGRRPAFADDALLQEDPHFRDHLLFFEYFHGDTGEGLGASHQTGWTALVAKLLQQVGPEATETP